MGDFSKHISRHEIACPCDCGFATGDHKLVEAVEDVCDYFLESIDGSNRIVLHINSWCRCKEYDIDMKKKNGLTVKKKPSEHLFGWATDFWLESVDDSGKRTKIDDDEIADYLELTYPEIYGIGRYKGRTHLDTRTGYAARWDLR